MRQFALYVLLGSLMCLCAMPCVAQTDEARKLDEYVEKAGNCYHMGQMELAYELVGYALALDSADTRALLLKIEVCSAMKKQEEALDACIRLKACPGEKPVELYTRWCAIYMNMNNPAAARDIVDEGLRLFPESFALNYSRGHVLMELGEYVEAYACYDHTFRMDPLAGGPPFLLGMLWDGKGCLGNALFFYLQDLMVSPTSNASGYIMKQLTWWPSREMLPEKTAGDEDFLIFEAMRDIHQNRAIYGMPYAVLSHSLNVMLRDLPVREEGYAPQNFFEAEDVKNETFRPLYADMRCRGLLEVFMHHAVVASDNEQNTAWLSAHDDDVQRLADYMTTIIPLFEKKK